MPLADPIRAAVARELEIGARPTALRRALAAVWSRAGAARLERPLQLPAAIPVVGVGGAVLGGAGKTPLAIALCRELEARGARPVLVGHAYRAAPERARVVLPDDPVALVGDDALCAARQLAPAAVPVVVGPTRQSAVDLAAGLGTVLVVDGMLQAAPTRVADAILVLDAMAPWGSGACPPLGDLRAPREALLAACDHVALVADGAEVPRVRGDDARTVLVPARVAGTVDGAGTRRPLAALEGARVGLVLAVARPARIERTLAAAGITPAVRVVWADHAPLDARAPRLARAGVDAWLTTGRCATKLPPRIAGAPVLALEHLMDAGGLCDRLAAGGGGLARSRRRR